MRVSRGKGKLTYGRVTGYVIEVSQSKHCEQCKRRGHLAGHFAGIYGSAVDFLHFHVRDRFGN